MPIVERYCYNMEESMMTEIIIFDAGRKQRRPKSGLCNLILFCAGFFNERNIRFTNRRVLCSSLEITISWIDKTLSFLEDRALLVKDRPGVIFEHKLTPKGWKYYENLKKEVSKTVFSPELNECEGKVWDILNVLKEPANIAIVTDVVMNGREFNVFSLYDMEMAMREDSQDKQILKGLSDRKSDLTGSFESMVEKWTIACKGPKEFRSFSTPVSILNETLYAERLRKQMKYDEALSIFIQIVKDRSGLDSSYRIFSIVGMINCMRSIGGEHIALEMTEDFLKSVKDPRPLVMLKKCKADILRSENKNKALEIYSSCIKSLNRMRLPALKVGVYNNMGIAYLDLSKWNEAEKSWKQAMKIAKEYGYVYYEQIIKQNIADVMAHKGKWLTARKILSETRRFFDETADHEGLSGYHFNMALTYVEEGRKEMALHHYTKCEKFKLMPMRRKAIYRQVMNERFARKGWDEPFPSRKDEIP
ncbi:MAG: tetratricopeptide repeat protein [Candidatus Thermoplasmatota archaeon]|nr:tetratricopeptide repeat protein [Candidatus Thermoplasmatota archaeon]